MRLLLWRTGVILAYPLLLAFALILSVASLWLWRKELPYAFGKVVKEPSILLTPFLAPTILWYIKP